jgi:hypothetical protein
MRMFGIQGAGYTALETFNCLLSVPGDIVETSGELQSDSSVRWEFSAIKAWPRGYEMRCRSLLDRTPEIRKSTQGAPRLNRSQMLKIIELVAEDDELRESLIECRTSESLEPLRTLAECDGDDSFAKEVLDIVSADKATSQ